MREQDGINFLLSHLSFFAPRYLGAVNDENVEKFHPGISEMETKYQGRFNLHRIQLAPTMGIQHYASATFLSRAYKKIY